MTDPKKPINYFAFQIFIKLMDRRLEPGYSDEGAINEAFRLSNIFLNYNSNPGHAADRKCTDGNSVHPYIRNRYKT